MDIDKMVEKPAPGNAPSRLAFAARYIFTPGTFDELSKTPRGKDNELQLTDAMSSLLGKEKLYGCRISGKRYDLGSKMGFLKGTVEFGLRRSEFKDEFASFLEDLKRAAVSLRWSGIFSSVPQRKENRECDFITDAPGKKCYDKTIKGDNI